MMKVLPKAETVPEQEIAFLVRKIFDLETEIKERDRTIQSILGVLARSNGGRQDDFE